MTRSTLKPALLAVAAAIGLAVAMATPASARTEVDRYEFPMGRFYGNAGVPGGSTAPFEADLLVFAGMHAPDLCTGAPPEVSMELDRIRPDDGVVFERLINNRATIEVYDGGGVELLEWIDTVFCPAVEAGSAPDPIATGVGNLQDRAMVDISGLPDAVHISAANSVRGTVRTAEGERWVIHAAATVEVHLTADPAGGWIEDAVPTDVHVHVLNRR
ncbi:hypothetical protein [Demequina lignilytica]|uniref:Uncharacterized protein n=1 Tax=Demequina lignilytica TaxID=3051663 RepID=A0AAW7M0P1_9MICO|nr:MULTISPECIES: hypothetical protein [unclassified Demequina]MDN4479238.1 hypothetical protein [Demequina sp. SYSU T00039-1]MDN4484464.1 hypothetical protein [Demequina sp. SYSU T0a273]MDN4487903.1 hypothetical protein [Demequina sp. SYSU T00039]